MSDKGKRFIKVVGWLIVAMPILLIWFGSALIMIHRGKLSDFFTEICPLLIQTLLVAVPLILLTVFSVWRLTSRPYDKVVRGLYGATVATVGTLSFIWGTYLWQAYTYSGGGVDFGTAFVLFFSPLYIPILMLVGYVIGQASFCCKN